MKRIDTIDAIANEFTDGVPTSGIPATTVSAAWLNAIQEEIAGTIELAGLTVDQDQNDLASNPDNNQLFKAMVEVAKANGGAGGGGIKWYAPGGFGAVVDEENDVEVYKFSPAGTEKIVCMVKVPESYTLGNPIKMRIGVYSESSTNSFLLKATTRLFKENVSAINTPLASYVSSNAAIANSLAYQYRTTILDLTTTIGQISGNDIEPGDLLKIELSRETDTDSNDVRFIPTTTDLSFS